MKNHDRLRLARPPPFLEAPVRMTRTDHELFPTCADFDTPTRELLSRAYERACDELEAEHHLGPGDLGPLIDAMTTALVDLFHAGEREEAALSRYAVSRALSFIAALLRRTFTPIANFEHAIVLRPTMARAAKAGSTTTMLVRLTWQHWQPWPVSSRQ